jgi:hypothetical protein
VTLISEGMALVVLVRAVVWIVLNRFAMIIAAAVVVVWMNCDDDIA